MGKKFLKTWKENAKKFYWAFILQKILENE
jgi:hypothetical protein